MDNSGNRTQAVETFDDDADGDVDRTNIFTWTYDGLNRLVRETYDGPEGGGSPAQSWDYIAIYSFDLASNRLTLAKDTDNANPASFSVDETITYAYNSNDQLQTEDSTDNAHDASYTYNDGGDQVTKTSGGITQHFTYDVMGRMTAVDTDGDNAVDVTYAYDRRGVRVSITNVVGGVSTTTHLVIDALNPTGYTQVLEERNAAGAVTRTYTLGMDVLAQVIAGVTPTIHRFLYDGHGSTRGLVSISGQTAEHYSYDAYGILINFTGTPLTNLLYSGEWRDIQTDLDNLRDRLMRFSTGTFTQSDRLEETLHKYNYADGNPIRYTDPSGEKTLGEIIISTKLFMANMGARVGAALAAGGIAVGRLWNTIGVQVQQFANDVFALFPRLIVLPQQLINGRIIDFTLRVGNRIANLEVKYRLPNGYGESFDRLTSQILAMTSRTPSGEQAVVWTLREQPVAVLQRIYDTVGVNAFNQVQFVYGAEGLYQWIKLFFKL